MMLKRLIHNYNHHDRSRNHTNSEPLFKKRNTKTWEQAKRKTHADSFSSASKNHGKQSPSSASGEPPHDTLTTVAEARVPVAKLHCTKIVYL
jgi:hypothetical protein